MTKPQHLAAILRSYGSACIGYSGGVDSAFLAVTALDVLGADRMLAVIGRSASYPDVQWETARAVATEFGVPLLEINTDEMQDPNYLANPRNRCFFCKTELWGKLTTLAQERGLHVVIDGFNADDAHDYRPGAEAARQFGVQSPLQQAGLSKAEIREFSRARGLPTWDQPSAPCLSSRLPYGLAVTPERLRQVESAEQILRQAGLRVFRVRHHGDVARIEVASSEMALAIAKADELMRAIAALGFTAVLLDVEGYQSGSLNRSEPLVRLASASRNGVRRVGHASDIAVVDAPLSEIEHVRAQAGRLKQQGFRYVAVELRSAV